MPPTIDARPSDATLTVAGAARLLGVHANTIRAWSDAGRLRYYRINARGDRRYRRGDLERFMAAAEVAQDPTALPPQRPTRGRRPPSLPPGRTTGPGGLATDPGYAPRGAESALAGLAELARLTETLAATEATDRVAILGATADVLRAALDAEAVALLERVGNRWVSRMASPAAVAPTGRRFDVPDVEAEVRVAGGPADPSPILAAVEGVEVAVPLGADRPAGRLLVAVFDRRRAAGVAGRTSAMADVAERLFGAAQSAEALAQRAQRAEAVRRIGADLRSRVDRDEILARLVDHALVLFAADRGAACLRRDDGTIEAEVARGLSETYLAAARATRPTLGRDPGGHPAPRVTVSRSFGDTADDPELRAAAIQEGIGTECAVTLPAGPDGIAVIHLYHDRERHWSAEDLDLVAALAAEVGPAVRIARDAARIATRTAQLQSIEQLGARLARLTDDSEIGLAIATELRILIDYHNVRVYRLAGRNLVPVAFHGRVGEYVDETPDQLGVAIGEGLTGWVAEQRIALNVPDAAADPRAVTIPGTEDDLDESMLLAPMVFEDQLKGVVVLSKLGLGQFDDGDLRLLTIYANLGAQAMTNAESTARLEAQAVALERQLRSQRELLKTTESILTMHDPRAILERIADHLAEVVAYDNISIEVYDRAAGKLRPVTARGVHATEFGAEWADGEVGLATWVIESDTPVLVVDEALDPRVRHFPATGPLHASLIVVPLHDRIGVTGVLSVERLDPAEPLGDAEFELVKLFAAQVSVALQNAEVYKAIEIRARTDDLTGLLNRGTFGEWLDRSVLSGESFSLIMLDLDAFGDVNNELGHQAGDRLLREMAEALVAAGRESDLVFRYGGDEFCLLLPSTDGEGARSVARRALSAVGGLTGPGTGWHADGARVTASVGYATFPRDGRTAEAILLAADRAAYVAKRGGGNRIATADDGLALAGEFRLQEPTPVDPPSLPVDPPSLPVAEAAPAPEPVAPAEP